VPISHDAGAEFDRQVQNLVDKGYPAAAGVSESDLRALVAPLREHAVAGEPTRARVPFVLVISPRLVPIPEQIARTELNGNPGFSVFDPEDIGRFDPIEDVTIPPGDAYLVTDVDRGAATLNVAPNKALPHILEQGRSPLTVAEGIAFITQFPASLEKNNCFSLLASRCGDKRVPALWISQKAPKLGWCWAGNPHTWLGSASCAGRTG
jgi:hypothetical protein